MFCGRASEKFTPDLNVIVIVKVKVRVNVIVIVIVSVTVSVKNSLYLRVFVFKNC